MSKAIIFLAMLVIIVVIDKIWSTITKFMNNLPFCLNFIIINFKKLNVLL